MIKGRVTGDGREATIVLNLRGPSGRTAHIEVVIDTGFTDALTLRQKEIDDLNLPWQGRVDATLADGRT